MRAGSVVTSDSIDQCCRYGIRAGTEGAAFPVAWVVAGSTADHYREGVSEDGPGAAGSSRPHSLRPLRGRQDEYDRLHALCAALTEVGGLRIAVIEGDAGMGKTRMLAELAGLCDTAGVQLAAAGCDSIAPDRPFGPLLEALGCERSSEDERRALIAERAASLATLTDIDRIGPNITGLELGARYGIQDELVDLLLDEADAGPLVLAVDDAQWLDVATASTLGALVRRRGHRPLGVILATRPDPRPPELETLLYRWHEDVETIRLGPLSTAVAGEVAADVLGRNPPPSLLAELVRAGGNAFSVVALARGFAQEGSAPLDGVRSSVLSRVYRLGDDAMSLLTVAAVLGTDFTPETLAVLSERNPFDVFDVLHGASRSGLLVSNGPAFAFSHALVADQLIDEAPEAVQAAVHRSILHHAAELDLGATTVAHHAMAVSMPGDRDAIDALRRAAAEVARHDPELALAYLERAADLCGGGPGQAEVALRRAGGLCALKRVDDAITVIDDALRSEREPSRIAELRAGRARCAHLLGDLVTATDELEQLARSGMLAPAAEAAAWADVATYRFWLLQGHRPWAEAERAITLADSCGAVGPAVQAIAAQATMAAFDGDVARGVELAALASARGQLMPHDQVIPSPAFTEGLALMFADDLDGAVEVLQRDRIRIERLGDPLLSGRPATALVIAQYLAGHWDDALAEVGAIVSVCNDTGSTIGRLVAPVITGLIAHHRGDDPVAEAALAEANAVTEAPEAYAVPLLLHLQALRLEAAGQPDAALVLLSETATVARAFAPSIGTWFAVDAARLAVGGGATPPDLVACLTDGLEAEAATVGLPGGIAFASIVAGSLRGDLEKVAGSLDGARGSPHVLTRSIALHVAGGVLWRRSADDRARSALDEARAGYEALGATPLAQQVASITGTGGTGRRRHPRPARPRFGWEALTPAERAVLDLVVDAKRNAEIAEHLNLSKRTVESHISSILTKVGVETRVALVVAAGRRTSGA